MGTTAAHRFAQPRIVAYNIHLAFQLAIPNNRPIRRKTGAELPRAHGEWIEGQEKRLRDTVVAGLAPDDAADEKARLA